MAPVHATFAVTPSSPVCGIFGRMSPNPTHPYGRRSVLRRACPPSFLTVLLLALVFAGCAVAPAASPPPPPIPLILVSLDGYHPDYLARGHSPTLQALADGGVRAAWMYPSYPSLTFPNHYTLVTGLRPDRHGIVENSMSDPELGSFALHNRAAVGDGRWWGGEPIWVTAQRAGQRTATMFWPGSEAPIQGIQPNHWFPFDGAKPMQDRVDAVLGWVDLPAGERPAFMTLYFERVDSAGHYYGPDAPELDQALRDTDLALARLVEGLQARGLEGKVNLVIVSDHGMAATSPERVVFVEDLVPAASIHLVTVGSSMGLDPRPGREAEVEAALLGRHAHHACWRREALPERWHYGSHPRIPAIVCQADAGWRFVSRERSRNRPGGWQRGFNLGSHGYDPADPSMRALFVAHGPAFRPGIVIPPFDNVHVHPLLARLLGLAPPDSDGDPEALAPILSPR